MHLPRSDRRCSSSSSYAPATLASDLSRIVDPSYYNHSTTNSTPSTASPSSSSFPLQPKVYVDHAGELHDPDYRDFPALPVRPKSRRPSSSSLTQQQQQQQHRQGPYGESLFVWGRSDGDPAGSAVFLPQRGAASHSNLFLPRGRSGSNASAEDYFNSQDDGAAPSSHRWSSLSAEQPRSGASLTQSPPATFHTGHGLRYQLNAMSLNLRLKVFRAKRRWRDRHHSQDTQI